MHAVVFACFRARLMVGRRIPMSTAMIPITTRSSTSVKPRRLLVGMPMIRSLKRYAMAPFRVDDSHVLILTARSGRQTEKDAPIVPAQCKVLTQVCQFLTQSHVGMAA